MKLTKTRMIVALIATSLILISCSSGRGEKSIEPKLAVDALAKTSTTVDPPPPAATASRSTDGSSKRATWTLDRDEDFIQRCINTGTGAQTCSCTLDAVKNDYTPSEAIYAEADQFWLNIMTDEYCLDVRISEVRSG